MRYEVDLIIAKEKLKLVEELLVTLGDSSVTPEERIEIVKRDLENLREDLTKKYNPIKSLYMGKE